MKNFARCLEYGKGTDQNYIRAAKYHRLSAEANDADAQNNFGICLERGIGVFANIGLACEYYERAAKQGHPDGANNFGFCLEHGRGIEQNIELASRYYKTAADQGHPEAEVNFRRCLRLLGRWEVPDRSSPISFDPPSCADSRKTFEPGMKERNKNQDLVMASVADWRPGVELGRGNIAVVNLACDPTKQQKVALKTLQDQHKKGYIKREIRVHQQLDHPLIVGFIGHIPASTSRLKSIMLEFVPNGSLFDHLPSNTRASELSLLRGDTRIAIIIVGIVLAMRYLHFRGFIHRDLKPTNILLDWDWVVRIADFSHAMEIDQSADHRDSRDVLVSIDAYYSAPEACDDVATPKCDVFSFGLILYEILTGTAAFSKDLTPWKVLQHYHNEKARPAIPDTIIPNMRRLIDVCWDEDPDVRPSFDSIFTTLEEMDFRITPRVNTRRVREFVVEIERQERKLKQNDEHNTQLNQD
jgi:hypothetical protein